MHSHPGDDPGSEQPSDDDIFLLDTTIDNSQYIISNAGLIEYHLPENLPGGYPASETYNLHPAWRHWIVNDLKLSEAEYVKKGGWELRKEFYEKFYGMRTIPWDYTMEIEAILAGKENLKPSTLPASGTRPAPPFPGRS